MIDYSVCGEFEKLARAIAQEESGGNEHAPLGDSNESFGLMQMHPAFFVAWYLAQDLHDTLAAAQLKAFTRFARTMRRALHPDYEIATIYHQGFAWFLHHGVDYHYWEKVVSHYATD